MKKQLLLLTGALLLTYAAKAQNTNANTNATGANWKSNGNAATTADFIGTTNAQDLIFKTNNIERLTLSKGGNLILKERIPGHTGELHISPGLINRPIPANPIAAYMLKVGGSGFFEGEVNTKQLFVQEYITYMKSLKGPSINVDSIKMDSTRGIYGHTKIFGDVNIKQNLLVEGTATFKNTLTAEKGIMFDAVNGIKFAPNTTGGGVFRYGGNNIFPPLSVPCAAGPQAWANHQFGGMIQLYEADPTGNYVAGSGMLNLQTWHFDPPIANPSGPILGGSSIDASIGGKNDPAALLINYFCGNSVSICDGQYGGNVSICSGGGGTVYLGKTEIRSIDDNPLDIIDPVTGKSNFRVKKTGVAYSREINVQLTDYPDYVFAKNYSLMPLDALDKYIAANKHLPNVPTAKEIAANGANLGELNKIQMEKIEELTLYIIELKKEVDALKKQVNNSK